MLLVTGGLGFIGSHTTRALLNVGEDCIVTQHQKTAVPDFLQAEIGTRVIVEPLDIADRDALAAIGRRHTITGIVHLADSAVAEVVNAIRSAAPLRYSGLFVGLGNILDAAGDWSVTRVTVTSTVGLYGGVGAGPWREDMLLPVASGHGIPAMKKVTEILSDFAASQTGLPVVCVRPSLIWGPGGRSSSFVFALSSLVHAAVRTEGTSMTSDTELFAEDGTDVCYVRDCAKAIALLQVAPTLNHSTYNIGGGARTTYADVVASIRRCVPGFGAQLSPGSGALEQPANAFLDLRWLREDAGYKPDYSLDEGIAEYIDWLQAGHDL